MNREEVLTLGALYGLKCMYMHKTMDGVELENKVVKVDCIKASDKMFPYWTYDSSFLCQVGLVGKGFRKNDIKPICFSMADLTKRIQIKEYNGGVAFVPIVELAKSIGLKPKRLSEICEMKLICTEVGYKSYCEFSFNKKSFNLAQFRNGNLAYMNWYVDQMSLFMQLIKWHFAVGMSEDEFVAVNEEFNPYK